MPHIVDRTQDLAALIATVTIDTAHITDLGFSPCGAAAFAAGGARLDADARTAYCDRSGEHVSKRVIIASGGIDRHAQPATFQADVTVPRLTCVITLDPALGQARHNDSLARLPKVHLITMGDGDLAPPARAIVPDGSKLAARIPGVICTNVTPGWHVNVLGLWSPASPAMLIAAGEDPIRDDPEGSDRQVGHDCIIGDIATELDL